MARKLKDHFEPWACYRSKLWESAFRWPPSPEEDPEVRDRWEGDRARAEKNAEWVIYGERMGVPAVVVSLLGKAVVDDDRRIITTVRRTLGLPEGAVDQEQIAKRICACVNACRGMVNPEDTVTRMRSLLLDLMNGEVDGRDDRVVALLSRMIPAEEQEQREESGVCS